MPITEIIYFCKDSVLCKVRWERAVSGANFEVPQVREFKMTATYRLLVDFLRTGSYRDEG